MAQIPSNYKPVECSHCGHKWVTRSLYIVVNCPRCGGRVRLVPLRTPIVKDKLDYAHTTHPDPYQVIVKDKD